MADSRSRGRGRGKLVPESVEGKDIENLEEKSRSDGKGRSSRKGGNVPVEEYRSGDIEPSVKGPSWRLPDKAAVMEAVRRIVRAHPRIGSQEQLATMVRAELEAMRLQEGQEEPWRISPERIRRVAIESGLIRVRISYQRARGPGEMTVCPVCGYKLSLIRNRTIDDHEVHLGFRCRRCTFVSDGQRRRPMRYAFSPRHGQRDKF